MRSKECQISPRAEVPRGEEMRTPDDVAAMLRWKALGWRIRRIACELGCSHMTVRRYLAEGGYLAYRRSVRHRTLTGLEDWLAERFQRHSQRVSAASRTTASGAGTATGRRRQP